MSPVGATSKKGNSAALFLIVGGSLVLVRLLGPSLHVVPALPTGVISFQHLRAAVQAKDLTVNRVGVFDHAKNIGWSSPIGNGEERER